MTALAAQDKNTGWLHLLPSLAASQRLLWLDAGEHRSTVPADWLQCAVTQHVASDVQGLSFADASFDAVICRLSDNTLSRDQQLEMVERCVRLLTEGGWLYVDIGAVRWSRRAACRPAFVKVFDRHGLSHRRYWPLLLERGVIAEVLPATGYRSCRNSWRAIEKFKELIYGRLASWFAPGYAFLVSRMQLGESNIGVLSPVAESGTFTRMTVNPAKSFFQPGDASDIPLLYVLPDDDLTVMRRRTEFATIARLRETSFDLRRFLPSICEERQLHGHSVFVMEAFDGVTVDLPVRGIDELYRRANQVLLRFNLESGRQVRVDGHVFESLIGKTASLTISRYPHAADALAGLLQSISSRLLDAEQTLVWMHGDYKLENLVFNKSDRSVQAVIDWELAAEFGWPLLDVMYLIAYREITRGQAIDILQVVENGIPQALDGLAHDLYQEHVAALALTENNRDVATAIFFIHHIGARFAYEQADVDAMGRIQKLALQLSQKLSNPR